MSNFIGSETLSWLQRYTQWKRAREFKRLQKRCERKLDSLYAYTQFAKMEELIRPLPPLLELAAIKKVDAEYRLVYDVAEETWRMRVKRDEFRQSSIDGSDIYFLLYLDKISYDELQEAMKRRRD
ncbi:MAG TPA: hypothetical protein VF281_00390 [Candidatus Saccharimonadales bacterium]